MATAEFIILIGLLGLAVGSFFNVCIDRLPRSLSIVALPSHCERCQHRLTPLDLVPVLSYLWLRGRCRYCKAPIPRRILLVEAVTGLLFAYVAFRYEVTLETVVVLGFVGILIVVFFIDLEHSLILNRVMYPAVAAALLVAPVGPLGQGQDAFHAYIDALLGIAIGGRGAVCDLSGRSGWIRRRRRQAGRIRWGHPGHTSGGCRPSTVVHRRGPRRPQPAGPQGAWPEGCYPLRAFSRGECFSEPVLGPGYLRLVPWNFPELALRGVLPGRVGEWSARSRLIMAA